MNEITRAILENALDGAQETVSVYEKSVEVSEERLERESRWLADARERVEALRNDLEAD